jgi:predicted lipid carrier protein YhbT
MTGWHAMNLEALAKACRADAVQAAAHGHTARIGVIASGDPASAFCLAISNGRVDVSLADEAAVRSSADVVLATNRGADVGAGTVSVQQLFLDGQLSVVGDTGVLLRVRGVLEAIGVELSTGDA